MALDYIVAGTASHFDLIRVLADHKKESDIKEQGIEKMRFCRYMDINSAMSMPAKINYGAKPWKKCCGKCSYTMSTLKIACGCNFTQDLFEVEVDGEKVTNMGKPSVNTVLVFVTNGKFTGGGNIINPLSCINDGLLDLTWIQDESIMGLCGVAKTMGQAKAGATHAYDGTFRFRRGKSCTINFTGKKAKKQPKEGTEQMVAVDGEDMFYTKYVHFECVPKCIEYIFDAKFYFSEHSSPAPGDKNH